MKCKICGAFDYYSDGSLCNQCSIAINTLNAFIHDLVNYLNTADSERLPDYYSNNLPYFVTILSGYNRYVSVKNIVQEIAMLYISSEPDEIFWSQDIENNEPLKIKKNVNFLSKNGFFSLEYIEGQGDKKIVPKEKLSISQYVLKNFGLDSPQFSDYFNSLLLYSMLGLVQEDIVSWISGEERLFPRRGFFTIRLMAGAIERALSQEPSNHYITSREILRALKGLTYKNQKKAFSQIIGIEFQSKSIFGHIPDPDIEDVQNDLTGEFAKMIDHLAERIRERMDRENIR